MGRWTKAVKFHVSFNSILVLSSKVNEWLLLIIIIIIIITISWIHEQDVELINFDVCFLLGNSPAPEFYMPTFRNTLFHLRRKCEERTRFEKCWGRNPPQPVSVLAPAPTLSLSFLMAQAIFEPTIFPVYTPTFLKPNTFYTHPPAYEDGTECSETSACKIQAPGNYPEESIQHWEHDESLKFDQLYWRILCALHREQVKMIWVGL
jgi:hypothetical protein